MRLAVFFVCLCVLLLKGYDYVHAGTHHITYILKQNTENAQLVKSEHTNQDYALIQDNDPDNDDDVLISDDAEDEDTDSFFARKYRLLVGDSWISTHLFILEYLHNCAKAPLYFGSVSSYKYITQKVLRI